jgi:hypothetical protein
MKVPNELVEVVYESLAGTKIYAMKDITQISAFRGVSAEKAKRFASLCLTEDELKALLDKAIDGLNKNQDIAQMVAILHELKFRVSMICEETSLLELAYIYLMIEGEDVERPSLDFNKKKATLIAEQQDLKGFFLRKALELVNYFSVKQGENLLSYLEETKILITRLSKFTQLK